MSEFNFFDIADVATFIISFFCCCRCCCGGMTVTDSNANCLWMVYCFRVIIGLLVVTAEFSTENYIFLNETNHTITAAYYDGLIYLDIYLTFIFVIIEILVIFICFLVCCCKGNNISETKHSYWIMITFFKNCYANIRYYHVFVFAFPFNVRW